MLSTRTCLESLKQRLFFIVGKGGVGRSSVSSSLAVYFSQKKENVLVVQWALSDSISPVFSLPPQGHTEGRVDFSFLSHSENYFFKTMNFNADEAIKEYFVDHLKMKLLYAFIIQNKHVQKLVHAAPGISELFFLGRLFWLVELAQKERGIFYDRIIVDTPATGHGVSLFGIAKAVANLGITGPLALECERVAKLLSDKQKTAVCFVTIAEELPVEECMESVPKVTEKLGFPPSLLIVNQSIRENLYPQLSLSCDSSLLTQEIFPDVINEKGRDPGFHQDDSTAQKELSGLVASLLKRNIFEKKLEDFATQQNINILSIPDFNLVQKQISPLQVIEYISKFFITGEVLINS